MSRRRNGKAPIELEAFNALVQGAFVISGEVYQGNPLGTKHATQYQALEILYQQGALHQKDIANRLSKTTGSMTPMIDSLEKRSFVRRVKGKDRRYLLIELTPEGEKFMKKTFPKQVQRIADALKTLSNDDMEHLKRICWDLVNGNE